MKTLYLITLYNWQGNEYARFAVTGMTEQEAQARVSELEPHFKLHATVTLCKTADDVFAEV